MSKGCGGWDGLSKLTQGLLLSLPRCLLVLSRKLGTLVPKKEQDGGYARQF
jgi:hypothetical protein